MTHRFLSVVISCALAATSVFIPATAHAGVTRDGAYVFGCKADGDDCLGTFRVSHNAFQGIAFRPVRCADGQVSASADDPTSDDAFEQDATATSSVSVPITFRATGSFRGLKSGSIRLTYSAPDVGCPATTSTYSFFGRDTGRRLGVQGWRDAGLAVDGAVDPDVVVLPDGRLRMYYVFRDHGTALITSSISTNGRTWTRERTDLRGDRWGPADVVRLPDGRFRMYYTAPEDPTRAPGQMPSITSAVSDNGLDWTLEAGHRLNPVAFPQLVPADGTFYRLGHPGVVQLADGTWLMLAAYSWDRGFDPHGVSSSRTTELIVWATSPDGLDFTARGIVVDSRKKATFDGYASSPDPVVWEDGTVHAFFWSPGPQLPHYDQKRYSGIQSTTFTGQGWTTPTPVRTSAAFPEAFAAGNNGADPTSAIFKGRWLLFHGHGGSDTGPSHEYTEYSVMTSTTYRMGVRRAGGRGTIASGLALGAGVLRADASTGLSCGTRCATTVLAGTRMWLHARPARGYRFVRWTGCNATRPRDFPVPLPDVKLCWVRATKNVTVTARFAQA